jgi:hypothetical protein
MIFQQKVFEFGTFNEANPFFYLTVKNKTMGEYAQIISAITMKYYRDIVNDRKNNSNKSLSQESSQSLELDLESVILKAAQQVGSPIMQKIDQMMVQTNESKTQFTQELEIIKRKMSDHDGKFLKLENQILNFQKTTLEKMSDHDGKFLKLENQTLNFQKTTLETMSILLEAIRVEKKENSNLQSIISKNKPLANSINNNVLYKSSNSTAMEF